MADLPYVVMTQPPGSNPNLNRSRHRTLEEARASMWIGNQTYLNLRGTRGKKRKAEVMANPPYRVYRYEGNKPVEEWAA